LSRVTLTYWLRQLSIYAGLVGSIICWWIIIASMVGHPGFNVAWTVGIVSVNFMERLWTVRRAGRWGMLLSVLMVPEFLYDVFRIGVFIWSAAAALAGKDIAWGHVSRQPVR
jgi:inner membrane protein involved in colicin E2 resistance